MSAKQNKQQDSLEYDPMRESKFWGMTPKPVHPKICECIKRNKNINGKREACRDGLYKMTNEDWSEYKKYQDELEKLRKIYN